MNKYVEIFIQGYTNYANYLWGEISNPGFDNYFYWLLFISAFFFLLEILNPWRKNQATFRKDFWLDFFYMFFNFFLFSLIWNSCFGIQQFCLIAMVYLLLTWLLLCILSCAIRHLYNLNFVCLHVYSSTVVAWFNQVG